MLVASVLFCPKSGLWVMGLAFHLSSNRGAWLKELSTRPSICVPSRLAVSAQTKAFFLREASGSLRSGVLEASPCSAPSLLLALRSGVLPGAQGTRCDMGDKTGVGFVQGKHLPLCTSSQITPNFPRPVQGLAPAVGCRAHMLSCGAD